ncbi:HNH endonuclease [Kurthia massiliensis]|uniref:HNH endonuclease n=1 Tax=Kurthia massiliensis TaxID=1033739 RepID=UPI00028A3C24|nr:HNH endonuclease [Kurthia massiliensis]
MAIELWKPVYLLPGMSEFREEYEVSNFGRLKLISGKVSKMKPNEYGYIRTALYTKDSKQKSIRLHRLVALAFVPGYEEDLQVNHIDENKANNHYTNLEWVSARENNNHGTRTERAANSLSQPVEAITDGVIFTFKSTQHAHEFGFNGGSVSAACRGVYCKKNSHGGTNFYKGYEWRYAN